MDFDPDSITQEKLHALRKAAEYAWGEDTRHPDMQGNPNPSAGQCFVTAAWMAHKLGGHIGEKDGHFFWVSPDKRFIIDLSGEQNATTPVKTPPYPQDAEDEPYEHHPDKFKHLPGPILYVKANHSLFRNFRVRDYPDNSRFKAFKLRADKALEGKRTADLMGADPYPGSTPQAEENQNMKYFHDSLSDMQLTMEEPKQDEYTFFYGNGQLHVSPLHDHEELREHARVQPNDQGPVAAGYVGVQGGTATWSVESNIALRGLVRELKDYCKTVGWKWGGLVGGDGQPVAEDLGAKKSMWYGWDDEVQLSEHPFYGAVGRIDIDGNVGHIPSTPMHIREGLWEWADDHGIRIAEYPGGGDANDKMKNKEWTELYDRGNPEAEPETQPEFEVPMGELTCKRCGQKLDDYNALVLHMKDHEPMDAKPEVEEGHFPYPEDKDEPLPLHNRNVMPTAMPLASVKGNEWERESKSGSLIHYGAFDNGQMIGSASVDPGWGEASIVDLQADFRYDAVATSLLSKIALHYPECRVRARTDLGRIAQSVGFIETEKGVYRYAAGSGQEAKDMLQAGIPFVYDIKADTITVGHPGGRSSDIMHPEGASFTPGGIVEGVYEPGGKMVINTATTMPYSTYHMMQLWYWSHPQMEITGLELEKQDGTKQKLASVDVGAYIKTLAASDAAAWNAYQALRKAGGQVYVVGGAIRDALLQKQPKDIDLMVAGLPTEEVLHILKSIPGHVDLTGKRFGVYRYHTRGQEVEIALPRSDDYGAGGKRADGQITVDHNLPVEKDLVRRDFTVNSMAVNLDTGELVDPYGGQRDIESHILRTTHPDSFAEDPSRLVRALVATSRHGLAPDEKTRQEMAENAYKLDSESPDVLKQQLDKLLESPNPAGAVRLAHETGVLKHLFPELDNNFDYDQNNVHHNFTLGEHTLHVLDNVARETKDPDLRLAAMLHDIGKPASAWTDPATGRNKYHPGIIDGQPVGADHAIVGADMAEKRLRETFNFPVSRIRNVHNIISQHMFPNFETLKGARKFLNKAGDAADNLLTLRYADHAGKGVPEDVEASRANTDRMRDLIEQVRGAGMPTDQTGLSMNGNDLIAMGLKRGPQVGTVLRQLTNDVIEDPGLNERSKLEQRAKEYIDAQPV